MLDLSLLHHRFHEQISLAGSGRMTVGELPLDHSLHAGDAVPSHWQSILGEIQFEFELVNQRSVVAARIVNRGDALELPWHSDCLAAGQTKTVPLPLQIRQGDTTLEIRDSQSIINAGRTFQTISRSRGEDGQPLVDVKLLGESPGGETLASWFEALSNLERSVSGSNAMLNNTAKAVCEPGGMNGALIIFRENNEWRIKTSYVPHAELGIAFSRDLIERVAEHGQTHYHDACEDLATSSRSGVDSVIAAPIFDSEDAVIGIVYGIRSLRGENLRRGVRPLEALWTQLLAQSVSGRLLRMKAEAEAARNRVMLEQVFCGKVVDELLTDASILESRDREVTTLFADLRGYSRISEKMGPELTHRLLSEILESLTECTQAQDGVIIDYYGDGLAAMWNAPTDQPDHAVRACHAAMAMHEGLSAISERWHLTICEPLRLGIGIHTGVAQVGNSGTKTRLKYGPRGQSVVVASRLESATRRTRAKTLISSETRKRLPANSVIRRVCRGVLPGIQKPRDLFELVSLGDVPLEDSVLARIDAYETALALVEDGQYDEADAILSSIGSQVGDHLPTDFLADYVQRQANNEAPSPVVDLSTIKT